MTQLIRSNLADLRRWMGIVTLMALAPPAIVHGQNPAQDDAVVSALTGQLTSFFTSVSTGDVKEAYEALLTDSQLAKRDRQEQLGALIKKTSDLPTNYGAFHSFERITAKRVGTDLVVFKYLYKCENFPIVWHVVFYRDLRESRSSDAATAYGNWRVISVRFDTDLEILAR
ncbi:MAG TPA: hypothetical protein VGJ26_03130 [Pirellulales bacterium]|jgi:hypothetical protein